jgi:signal peptidase I
LITTLYVYFVPTAVAMPDALSACIKIIFPILMLAFVSALYSKRKKNAVQKGKKLSLIATIISICVITSIAMLISCEFRYGAVVVATESMTGEINKGDMIIYERYEDQHIKEGLVIVFLHNKSRIIHRVVEIKHVGNETRYYTKGDANEDRDAGYVTDADIVGLTDLKFAYLGYPTLWLREIIKK